MALRQPSRYLLLFSLIWILPMPATAQVDQVEFNTYLGKAQADKLNNRQYLIIHTLNNCPYFDREWISRFVNVEQEFREILFVIVIEDSKQLGLLSDYALQRENLVIDSTYTFQNQSFYNYYPTIYSVDKGRVVLEKIITYETSYGWWSGLYRKYKK